MIQLLEDTFYHGRESFYGIMTGRGNFLENLNSIVKPQGLG